MGSAAWWVTGVIKSLDAGSENPFDMNSGGQEYKITTCAWKKYTNDDNYSYTYCDDTFENIN